VSDRPTRNENVRAPHGPALHRRWIWWVYLLLFALSVPWYLPADDAPALWLGLPYWVVVSLLAMIAIAGFTAWVIQCHWPLDEDEP
jgi:hypothetical protein